MIKKLKEIKAVVKKNLESNEGLRDSDNRLVATIWYKQCGGKESIHKLSALEILEMIAKGKLSSCESIMRVRRKIQEEYPELRGKSCKVRKAKQVEVRKQIHSV